jgi:hypothetical protein
MLSVYQRFMIVSLRYYTLVRHALTSGLLLVLGLSLLGCAGMSDGMTSAFADPAKYELYNCKQLEAERKALSMRQAELQGLIAKAQSGVGGPVVAELAYRNEYIAVRGQAKNADEAWARNKCRETPPEPGKEPAKTSVAPAATGRSGPAPLKSGSAVY